MFQRVEKELQEKAAAQLLPSKREAGDGGETVANDRDRSVCVTLDTGYIVITYDIAGIRERQEMVWRTMRQILHNSQTRMTNR